MGAGTSPAPGCRPPRQRASCCFHIRGSQANLRLGRAVVIARSAIANGKEKRKQSTAPRHLAPTTQDTGAAGRQPRPMRQPLSPVLLACRSRGPALGPGGGEDWVEMRRPSPLRDPRSKTGGISPIRLLPSSSRPLVLMSPSPTSRAEPALSPGAGQACSRRLKFSTIPPAHLIAAASSLLAAVHVP